MVIIASAAGVITSIGPITFPRQLRTFDFNLQVLIGSSQKAFGDPEFPLSGARDSGFQSKIVVRFETMRWRWNAKNNPRDYDIALFLGRDSDGIEELTGDALNSFSLI